MISNCLELGHERLLVIIHNFSHVPINIPRTTRSAAAAAAADGTHMVHCICC
jgi:hypothetical protein